MELEGKIIFDLGKTEGTSKMGNHWQKREWVLETLNTNYPRKVKFHVFGDKADQMIFEPGKNYAISFDVESREFNGRWYTDISCYAMRLLEGAPAGANFAPQNAGFSNAAAPSQQPANFGNPQPQDFAMPAGDQSDDLPF
ncbi:MAG: DUF3127 domain-containing protein [Clostridium sp.]|nr:DUF3127 domain-containing protein [Clostridium sp.]